MTKCACDATSQNASASTDASSAALPPTCATATTTRVRVTEPHFSEMECAIMEKVFVGRGVTAAELAVILKKSPSSIRRRLSSLKAKGSVVTSGYVSAKGRRHVVWVPTL